MIKLKDLVNESRFVSRLNHSEWYPAHTRASLDWTLTRNYIPLYPKQIEDLFGKVPINSFHVTSPQNIRTITDVIGKKKSISTFTKANKSSQLAKGRGVQTGSGGVIFHIKGLLLARKWQDFDTVPDRTGRRWVLGRHIFGDAMILTNALEKAGLPGHDEWNRIEYKMEQKIENDPKYEDLPFREVLKVVTKELGPIVQKHLKKYIDTTNKLLKKYKDEVQKNTRKKSSKNSSWWNEILVYNTEIIDCFVLQRVWDDYYFQKDSSDELAHKKYLLNIVPGNKITIGSPAQFRKWYTAREGEITLDE